MSSERIMKNRCSTWMALTGILLTASVCDAGCIKHNFKEHITDNLLVDHWFQVKSFTPPGEDVKLQHEFLSVLNTICSSLIANQQFIMSDPLNGKTQSKVVWTYIKMIKALVIGGKMWNISETVQFCLNKSCSEFYSTRFINTTQFERIYKKVCVFNETVAAACPPAQTDLQTSSELTDGSSSRWSDSQHISSDLVVAVVVSTIIIIIIIFSILLVHFSVKASRCHRNVLVGE